MSSFLSSSYCIIVLYSISHYYPQQSCRSADSNSIPQLLPLYRSQVWWAWWESWRKEARTLEDGQPPHSWLQPRKFWDMERYDGQWQETTEGFWQLSRPPDAFTQGGIWGSDGQNYYIYINQKYVTFRKYFGIYLLTRFTAVSLVPWVMSSTNCSMNIPKTLRISWGISLLAESVQECQGWTWMGM